LEVVEQYIEVFAIGINSAGVNDYYSNSVVIKDLNDLPKSTIQKLDQLLRRNKSMHRRAG
jgi:hypothetical protein